MRLLVSMVRLIVLCIVLSGNAWAISAVDAYYVTNAPNNKYPTAEAACSAYGTSQGLVPPVKVFDDLSCGMYYPNGGFFPMQLRKERGGLCPANSSINGSSCVCNSGFSEQNGQCVKEILQNPPQCLVHVSMQWHPHRP